MVFSPVSHPSATDGGSCSACRFDLIGIDFISAVTFGGVLKIRCCQAQADDRQFEAVDERCRVTCARSADGSDAAIPLAQTMSTSIPAMPPS